ncbi:hypothetical protein CEO49_19885, partial [Klebsiella variicola]
SWMAHHQGMAFQALAHVLLDAPMTERFMSSTVFRSASLLLQERVPDAVDLYSPRRHFESHEGMVKPVRYEPRIFYSVDTRSWGARLLRCCSITLSDSMS